MIQYNLSPKSYIKVKEARIATFLDREETKNIDWKTVDSFGEEWNKFNSFTNDEIEKIGDDYFDIVPGTVLNNATVLDMGCGSGRWSKYLSSKVKWIEAIDPSNSIIAANGLLSDVDNVRITQASVDKIPFEKESFDLVVSLGVLHHIPNTQKALEKCTAMVKKGGHCLIYLYYSLENRPFFFRFIFKLINLIRKIICKMPDMAKKFTCDLIAILIYWPLSRFSKVFKKNKQLFFKIPLSYYHNKSMTILRNDALDRFGTPLEQRFSRNQIEEMMLKCGLEEIRFSEKAPYWHAIGVKK